MGDRVAGNRVRLPAEGFISEDFLGMLVSEQRPYQSVKQSHVKCFSLKFEQEFLKALRDMVKPDFFIAGLGCSAGCLDVLKTFFANVPERTGIAFVVVQHLSRNYVSILDKLLQSHTKLPIIRVLQDMEIKPDHIYLMPEGKFLLIRDGILHLIPRTTTQVVNYAVDTFFTSLAAYAGNKAIGIILTGMGTDGLEGAKAIEGVGGIVFVQEPSSAVFKGMPVSVITGDEPDVILPPAELAQSLAKYYKSVEMQDDEGFEAAG
jgi:two-component system CheB/CheR fusion protein